MSIAFYKVTALPQTLAANALYFVAAANGQLMEVHMSNSQGTAARKVLGEAELNAAIAAYDAQGASKLAEAFELALGGDLAGAVSIDGSGDVTLTATLSDVVAAGSAAFVTFNSKGQITGSRALTAADLPAEITSDTSGNAATATLATEASKVTNALTVNGQEYDGSAAVELELVPASAKGVAGGVATLDSSGLVPAAQLPSFVDDVLEANAYSDLPAAGEANKLYVILTASIENEGTGDEFKVRSGDVFRWSGTRYVKVSDAVSTSDVADTLSETRQIGVSGDATGQAGFNGSGDAIFAVTLKNVGTAGEQAGIVTTDAAGRVTGSRALALSDLPAGIESTSVALAEPAAW